MLKYQENGDVNSIIDMREEYTYGVKTTVEEKEVEKLIVTCREIIEITKQKIYD
ncbi:MAG: hypothetical protein MAG795_01272 [Candidatus Woesearchaeota archaeon]|nr:hypothetical protein [Candidatus Woesearchaeota archaeon]